MSAKYPSESFEVLKGKLEQFGRELIRLRSDYESLGQRLHALANEYHELQDEINGHYVSHFE